MSVTPPLRAELTREAWARMAAEPAPPLLALWADTRDVYALLHGGDDGAPQLVSTALVDGGYPALSPARPVAAWFERMVHDLWGHAATDGTDQRPWLDHGHWPQGSPMALRPGPPARAEPPEFLMAEELDQVPLGPVRGCMQPAAHLRLGIHGETIVRLETRLGYTHKASLTLMRGKSPRAAARFAARLAGEATVAHAIAFASAAEAALECEVSPRAVALRGVMAEIERITHHLDILATTAEMVGPAVLVTWCARHGEALRRAADIAFGHRLMMDCVVPGGVAADVSPGGPEGISRALSGLANELSDVVRLPLARRLSGVGVVTAAQAALFAGGGLICRAGDAEARVRARFDEIGESARLVRNRLGAVPDGAISTPLPVASGEGIGFADGPAGGIWHWLRLDHGQIASVFMCDPAWAHWPLLEAMMAGGQADDLPLVLAGLGLSSSAVDL
jgi:Ni,Fe-hydrogenase III large subunit